MAASKKTTAKTTTAKALEQIADMFCVDAGELDPEKLLIRLWDYEGGKIDASVFAALPKLEELRLMHAKQKLDLRGLERCTTLREVQLHREYDEAAPDSIGQTLASLRGLVLPSVERVSLDPDELSFSALRPFPKLAELWVSGARQLSDWTELPNLKSLAALHIRVSDFDTAPERISVPTSLRSLSLSGFPFHAIPAIEGAHDLERLELSSGQIERISGLEKLPKLEVLKLTHQKLQTLDGLEHLDSLTAVDFTGNEVTDLAAIETLARRLTSLDLTLNQVTQLTLPESTTLAEVNFSHNHVKKIAGVERLPPNCVLSLGGHRLPGPTLSKLKKSLGKRLVLE